MAPPPDSGDATNKNDDDPLGGMDPMAWLESLAARQGANPDELTTEANLDIEEPPADTVVDEPGYTPGYDVGKSSFAAQSESAKTVTPEPQSALEPEPAPEPAAAEPVASTASADDPLGGMDPMAWLESLAARQGASADELTTEANLDIAEPPADTVVDEPGYTPGYDVGKSSFAAQSESAKAPAPEPEPTPEPAYDFAPASEPAAPEPVASTASADDPLGGMDPMAWLESLAARQGASADELTTEANLEIEEPPADTVVDEPGYTPGYDVGKSSFAAQSESAKAAPEPEPAPEPAYDFAPANEPEPATPEPVASTASADDPLGGMDPMEWLESLAARQGASADELTTEANFDIAEPPADTFIDEPGYVDYDPFGGSGVARPAEPAASAPEPEAQPAASMEGDTLSWLEDMAAQQNADAESLIGEITPEPEAAPTQNYAADAPFPSITPAESSAEPESALSWLEDLAKGQTGMLDAMTLDSSPQPASINEGGMSDDINEVQAWLESQARNLEQTRVELDEQDNPDNLAPAEPATDLPDWLRASMPASGGATTEAPKAPALSDEIATPNAPSDLPNWLRPTPEPSADLEQDLLASIQDAGGTSTAEPVQDLANISDEELEALTRPSSPDEVDSWAEALDEEFDRKAAGDESVPDWYQEAIKRAEAQKPRSGPVPTVTEVPEPSIQAPAASTSNVPDWLQEDSFADSAAALPGDIPDWLRTVAPEAPTSPAQAALPAASTEIPDWLQAAAPTPAPAPVTPPPVQQAPAPEPRPRPAPTPPPAPSARPVEAARVRPATPPGPEHQEHLQTARQMVASSQYPASLEHYQALIDSAQLLEETRGDLRQLVENQPADPKLRRLLGDAHMRLGDLQAALDTYRSALDQL